MEPLTVISGALSILKATGLDKKLGNLIGGDTGEAVAEKVVTIAQGVTGATDLSTAVKDVQKDPSLAAEVHKALIAQETELYRLALEDWQDARAMQVAAMKQADPFVKRFIYYLASFWSIVATAFIFLIIMYPIPKDNLRFADVVLGFVLGTIIATIIQFFFGSMLKQDTD